MVQPTVKVPTNRRQQVYESRLHDRLECVKNILSDALLRPCGLLALDFDEIESEMMTMNEKSARNRST